MGRKDWTEWLGSKCGLLTVLKNGKEIICAYYIEKEEAGKLMAEILKQLEQIEENAK